MSTLQEKVLGVSPPANWDEGRLHRVLRLRSGDLNRGMKERNLLSLSYGRIVRRDILSPEGLLPESFETYQIVNAGDIVLRLTDLQNDKRSLRQGLVLERGIITSAYDVVRPHTGYDSRFWFYLLYSLDGAKYYYSLGGGVRQSLRFSHFPNDPIAYPPPEEQYRIARFLDRETAYIDRLIEKKERLISLLEEKRSALISRAVTKGLDPDVPMKDPGVEWIREVPEHWGLASVRRIAKIDNSGSYGEDPDAGDHAHPVATTAQIDDYGRFDVDAMPVRGFTTNELHRYRCTTGDILVVKSSGSVSQIITGKTGLVTRDTPPFVFSNFLMRLVPDPEIVLPEYLFLVLTSRITRERVKRMVAGTTYPNLRVGEYISAPLPLPPLKEQVEIYSQVQDQVKKIDEVVEYAKKSIALLRERRPSLITAAVTGQIDPATYEGWADAVDEALPSSDLDVELKSRHA